MVGQLSAAMDRVWFAGWSSTGKLGTSWNISEVLNAAAI